VVRAAWGRSAMNISQLQHGETCTLLLSPEGRPPPPEIGEGQEARLVFPRTGDEVLLSAGGAVIAAVVADDATRRGVAALRETDPARLCWIVVRRDKGADVELTVQVHRFRSRFEWTGKVALA